MNKERFLKLKKIAEEKERIDRKLYCERLRIMQARRFGRCLYVLSSRSEGQTLQEIADNFGLCRETIRQIEARGKRYQKRLKTTRIPKGYDVFAEYKKEVEDLFLDNEQQ